MSSVILTKFNKYVYFPDLANKFNLASYVEIIPTMKYSVYLKYIFSQRGNYSYIALKALMMLNSIYPQRCHYFSRIIVLKYAKTRSHSVVYFKLNIEELSTFLRYSVLKPTTMSTALTGHIRESKSFIFPGFIRHLKIPSWNYFVNISWNHTKKDCYPAFFHKSAYLD